MGTVNTASTTLQLWASDTVAGPYGRLYKVDGSAADLTLSPSTTEARVYALPDECYGVGALKIVSVSTNSTAATCVVMLKS
jgi:hypothetical protein